MSRFELGGPGKAIPTKALPDNLLTEESSAPVLLVLEDGQDFDKADYVGLGYTNYEVWCIGAAGGQGGYIGSTVHWLTTKSNQIMPIGLWNDFLAWEDATYGSTYPPGYMFDWNGSLYNYHDLQEAQNPTHTFQVVEYHDPILIPSAYMVGGGGGGGGLHKVSGLLADLPSLVPVVVGEPGADGAVGQGDINGLLDPNPYKDAFDPYPAALPADKYPQYISTQFTQRYPEIPILGPPGVGEDGGASSFGDICQASGGKGGAGAIEWISGTKYFGGYGGDGGSGGTLVAGGGGLGSTSSDKTGKDGSWNGSIGKGGGGGRGGRLRYATPVSPHLPDGALMHEHWASPPPTPPTVIPATNGGQGSFNYGDTSVFGQRAFKSGFIVYNYVWDPDTGVLISKTPREYQESYQVVPGSGGGAKAPGKRWYGSRAAGYSPNGLVLIKIYKV